MRYIEKYIKDDLNSKMVFVSGPRQAGKTTLANDVLKLSSGLYLNWDLPEDRKKIIKHDWSNEDELLVFDEIHKYSRWKNLIKGYYDHFKNHHQFIITGSARLDIYRQGQDSMLGRFFSWRLHPLCLAELKHHFSVSNNNVLDKLLEHGGFPEPFFKSNTRFTKRWRNERRRLVFRQDIQEIEKVKDISLLELFYDLLRERVGSQSVMANIARDLEVAPKTAKTWLALLERTYAIFLVMPYSGKIAKAVTKAPKVYFFDNGEVEGDLGARFENLVANHLYKKIHFLEDSTGDRYQLSFIRDQNQHEVDFVILKNRKPILLIEVKLTQNSNHKSINYFKEKLKVEKAMQIVKEPIKSFTKNGILTISATDWLSLKLETEL